MSTVFREHCRWCGSSQYELSSLGPGLCKRCANAAEVIGKDMHPGDPDYPALLRTVCLAADSVPPQYWKEPFGNYRERIVKAMQTANQPQVLNASPAEPEPVVRQAAKREAERRRVAKAAARGSVTRPRQANNWKG